MCCNTATSLTLSPKGVGILAQNGYCHATQITVPGATLWVALRAHGNVRQTWLAAQERKSLCREPSRLRVLMAVYATFLLDERLSF